MGAWQPMSTAPKDGSVFLASDENDLLQLCFIEHREERRVTKRDWLGRKTETVEREGGAYLYYALPFDGEYSALNIRGDSYSPKWWMSLDDIPPLPEPAA